VKFNQNKKFMFAFDLDGTLIADFYQRRINQTNLQLINKLNWKYKDNFIMCFVSGRDLHDMEIEWNTNFSNITPQYHVAFNGSITSSLFNNKRVILDCHSLPLNQELINILNSVFPEGWTLFTETNSIYLNSERCNDNTFVQKILNTPTYKIISTISGWQKETLSFKKLMQMNKTKEITVYIHEEYGNFTEITKTHKLHGINFLINYLKIDPHNVIVIGNGPNDYTMLKGIINSFVVASHSLEEIPNNCTVLKNGNNGPFVSEIVKKLNLL